MLFYANEEFKLMPYLATYEQHGVMHTQRLAVKEELDPYVEMGHITKLTVVDAEYTQDMRDRLEEVKHYRQIDYDTLNDYVLNGAIHEGTRLDLDKRNQALELSVLDLSEMILGGMV